jgi:hypothetical protein
MATPAQIEIVGKRAFELLKGYYEAPSTLSLEEIVRALPNAACTRLLPHLNAIVEAHEDPVLFGILVGFFVKAGVLYGPDVESLRKAQEELSMDRWKADFGDAPYRPSLVREALLGQRSAEVPTAVDGEVILG